MRRLHSLISYCRFAQSLVLWQQRSDHKEHPLWVAAPLFLPNPLVIDSLMEISHVTNSQIEPPELEPPAVHEVAERSESPS